MAIVWASGFEDGVTRFSVQSTATVSTVTPRSGLRKVLMNNGSVFASSYGRVDHIAITSGCVYAAFKPLSQWQAAHPVLTVNDPGNTVSHILIWYRNDGLFEMRRGATVIGTSTTTVPNGTWCHLALELLIADVSGVAKLYINGNPTPEINFSGDTRNGGSDASWAFTYFGNWDSSQFSSITLEMDDCIVQDYTGSAPENAFLGDVGIDAALPDSDGDDTGWDIGGSSPAATRWQSVDEIPADDGVTLIEGDTVGERNLCNHAAVSTTVPVATFVAAMLVAKLTKATATDKKVQLVNKSGGVLGYGLEITLTTAYTYYVTMFYDDPSGSPWTTTNFNGAQVGVEVTA